MLHHMRLSVYAGSILLTSLNTRSKPVTRSVSNILFQIFLALPSLGYKQPSDWLKPPPITFYDWPFLHTSKIQSQCISSASTCHRNKLFYKGITFCCCMLSCPHWGQQEIKKPRLAEEERQFWSAVTALDVDVLDLSSSLFPLCLEQVSGIVSINRIKSTYNYNSRIFQS